MSKPMPMENEMHRDWMDRCMANNSMMSGMPMETERHAQCQVMWDNRGKSLSNLTEFVKSVAEE